MASPHVGSPFWSLRRTFTSTKTLISTSLAFIHRPFLMMGQHAGACRSCEQGWNWPQNKNCAFVINNPHKTVPSIDKHNSVCYSHHIILMPLYAFFLPLLTSFLSSGFKTLLQNPCFSHHNFSNLGEGCFRTKNSWHPGSSDLNFPSVLWLTCGSGHSQHATVLMMPSVVKNQDR